MLGLLLKDIYTLKKQALVMLFVLLFYFLFGIINDSPLILFVFLFAFSTLMPLTAMGYDEKNRCDRLFLCMPLTRRQLVSERYLLGFFLSVCSNLIAIASVFVLSKGDLYNNLCLIEILWGLCLFYFAICFPIALKYGVEKSRYIMLGLVFLPTLAVSFFKESSYFLGFIHFFQSNMTLTGFSIFAIFAGIILYCASWLLSIRLYERKEL